MQVLLLGTLLAVLAVVGLTFGAWPWRLGDAPARLVPHARLGVVTAPDFRQAGDRHDATGLRGGPVARPKPEGEFRIVCLGGSTTYTTGVDDHRLALPAQLERELQGRGVAGVSVVNAGVPGWTSWEMLLALSLRVLELEPDLLVVTLELEDTHARFVWPPDVYAADASGSRPAPEHDLTQRFHQQVRKDLYPSGVFAQVSAEAVFAANPPVFLRRNLESLVASAQRRRLPVVLVTLVRSRRFPGQPFLEHEAYVAALERADAVVREVARGPGARLSDLARRFPDDVRLFHDGVRVNAAGAARQAVLLADDLLRRGLLPEQP